MRLHSNDAPPCAPPGTAIVVVVDVAGFLVRCDDTVVKVLFVVVLWDASVLGLKITLKVSEII